MGTAGEEPAARSRWRSLRDERGGGDEQGQGTVPPGGPGMERLHRAESIQAERRTGSADGVGVRGNGSQRTGQGGGSAPDRDRRQADGRGAVRLISRVRLQSPQLPHRRSGLRQGDRAGARGAAQAAEDRARRGQGASERHRIRRERGASQGVRLGRRHYDDPHDHRQIVDGNQEIVTGFGAVLDAEPQRYTARLLIGCADQPGIVAAVSGFLLEQGANIVSSHQYSSDPTGGRFFMRTELVLSELGADTGAPDFRRRFEALFAAEVAEPLGMDWEIRYWGERRRIAILVSRHDHCLLDLLWRWRRGELDGDVVVVISNHEDLRRETESAGVPYRHIPMRADGKAEAEAAMLELLAGAADLVVLARYMQILSGDFLDRVGMPVINIHHSFLPAFAGANPYRRARERGVKLIGATAHYVTAELDDGPIIDQDVVRVDHRQSAQDLERVGRDIERLVLARVVALHLDDRVMVDGRRTVVF